MQQLQQLIDKRDEQLMGVGESKYISPNYKLQFQNTTNSQDLPESFADVFDKLEWDTWKSVSVTKLDYDEHNQIVLITLKPILP